MMDLLASAAGVQTAVQPRVCKQIVHTTFGANALATLATEGAAT